MLKQVVSKIKTFFIFFSVFLFNFFCNLNYSNASFFQTCGIRENDVKTIEYVLKNGTSKFIPSKIEEIYNVDFQKAVYLYLFYRDAVYSNFTMPIDVIDFIGFQNVERINRFKLKTLNYLLTNNVEGAELKRRIIELKLKDYEKLRLLQNRIFINKYEGKSEFLDKEFIKQILESTFSSHIVGYDDILWVKDVYNDIFTDELLLQQVRVRLFFNNRNNIEKVIKLIDNELYKNQARLLVKFDTEMNQKTAYSAKNKKGQKITKYRGLTLNEVNKICKKYLGKDEYFDLICMAKNQKNFDVVEDILEENDNPRFLPNKWLKYRLQQSRDAINGKTSLQVGYKKISQAGVLSGDDFYTQHFLAGFIAYINHQYHDAVYHFLECSNNSTYAESVAKANYWLGLAFEKLNNKIQAEKAFMKASEYVFTFYGQLANEELNKNPEEQIKKYLTNFEFDNKRLCNDIVFIAGYLDQKYGDNKGISSFLVNYLETNNQHKQDLFNALDVVNQDFEKNISIAYGYYNLRYNVVLQDASFPRISLTGDSFVNSVIKQESSFKTGAVSNKGARGIMQIMPSTGKKLAKEMGIKYDHKKLLHDTEYNVRMGRYYLNLLLDRFGGHKVLSLASYNAGALNVNKWIEKNGNPQDMDKNEEIATWIEKIPFSQTRGYVVSILGSEMVYDVLRTM